MKSNHKNLKHLKSLETKEKKLRYMTGGYVTIGKIGQVKDHSLVHSYCPKIRGIFIGDGEGGFLFDNPEEAREAGKKVMEDWKEELGHRELYEELMDEPLQN